MTLWHLAVAFFVANILGYGGGPSTIPLMESQIVSHYHFMSSIAFANLLALANALPGPVATKIAAAVGYQQAGVVGALVALLVTVLPSAIALIFLVRLLNRYRGSSVVRGMTMLVMPVIAVLLFLLTWEVARNAIHFIGWWQTLGIAGVSAVLLFWRKWHPVFVIIAAFLYGGLVLPHLLR